MSNSGIGKTTLLRYKVSLGLPRTFKQGKGLQRGTKEIWGGDMNILYLDW